MKKKTVIALSLGFITLVGYSSFKRRRETAIDEENNSMERRAKFKELDYKDRSMIKDGDILLFKGKSIESKIIEFLTVSPYSHAGVAVWWSGRLVVIEAIWRGVIADSLKKSIRRYKGEVEWWCLKSDIDDKRGEMVKFAQDELGKGFAFWRIVCFLWRIIKFSIMDLFKSDVKSVDRGTAKKRYFCAEFVSATYNHVKIDLCPNNSDWYTSAGDIHKSDKIEYQATLDKKFLQSLPE